MTKRVLIVDDDPDIRKLVELSLDGRYETEGVGDGQAAIEILAQRPGEFDAMVLDLSMPAKTGFEVLEHIREQEATQQLPVLVLTARSDTEAQVDVYVGGGHEFVSKPFDPEHLLLALGELMRRSDHARQAGRLQKLINLTD